MGTKKVSTRTGTVSQIAEKKNYRGGRYDLCGVIVSVKSEEESGTTWTDSVQIPLGWVPEGLKIGSKLRVTVESVDDEPPVSQSGDYEGTIGIGSVLAERIDSGTPIGDVVEFEDEDDKAQL